MLVSSLALQPASVLACATGTTSFQRGSSRVLPDGLLMLLFSCSYDCQPTPPTIKVLDGDGAVVSGRLVSLKTLGRSLWVAWRPTRLFVVGAKYSALADGAPWEFETTTSTLPAPEPVLTFQATLTSIGSGDTVCCERTPFRMFCHGESGCFQKQRQEAVLLDLKGDSGHSSFDFLYRITFRSGSETKVLPDQPWPQAAFVSETAANDYCYEVDAVRPETGELIHVADGCQSLGVRSFGVRPPTDVELLTSLSVCAQAPTGYEAEWKRLGFSGRPGDLQSPDAGEDLPVEEDEPYAADAGSAVTPLRADSGCALAPRARAPHALLVILVGLTFSRLTRRSRGGR